MNYWKKFFANPIRFIKHVIYKLFIAPLKYGRKDDYDAFNYWEYRLKKYGKSLRAVGDEGMSEQGNLQLRKKALTVLHEICHEENINLRNIHILEIGCGNGFYTDSFWEKNAYDYTGVDITDALFSQLRQKFPSYKFIKNDVTKDLIEGEFDLIIMMDVIQHVVNREKLNFTLGNINQCLSPNGLFIIWPVTYVDKKHLFYVHRWSFDSIEQSFTENFIIKRMPFRADEYLLVIRKLSTRD